MRTFPIRLAAFFSPLLLAACAGAAPSTAPAPEGGGRAVAEGVVLCRTTEAELRAALGPPTRDGRLRDQRVLSWIVDEGSVVAYLAVLVDVRGVVADLYWNLPTEIPWTPSNQCRAAG
jgi:hypothetical protein